MGYPGLGHQWGSESGLAALRLGSQDEFQRVTGFSVDGSPSSACSSNGNSSCEHGTTSPHRRLPESPLSRALREQGLVSLALPQLSLKSLKLPAKASNSSMGRRCVSHCDLSLPSIGYAPTAAGPLTLRSTSCGSDKANDTSPPSATGRMSIPIPTPRSGRASCHASQPASAEQPVGAFVQPAASQIQAEWCSDYEQEMDSAAHATYHSIDRLRQDKPLCIEEEDCYIADPLADDVFDIEALPRPRLSGSRYRSRSIAVMC